MIRAQHLSYTIGDRAILDDTSFVVPDGHKVGLIGPNGTGKTTIFRLIMGQIEPEQGIIETSSTYIGHLPQVIVHEAGATIATYLTRLLEYEWEEYKIDRALADVGLSEIDRSLLMETLSGGQRARVAIAGLLIAEPDILLLDEPTNNLDSLTILWLEQFVRSYRGTILVISHDRTFLDVAVDSIMELDAHTHIIQSYTGTYTNYLVEKQHRREVAERVYERHEEKRQDMEKRLAVQRERATFHASTKAGKRLKALQSRYEREILDKPVERPRTEKLIAMKGHLTSDLHAKRTMYYVKDFTNALFHIDSLLILATQRIHLTGDNGAGKSTLIKLLLDTPLPDALRDLAHPHAIQRAPATRVGYFAQGHEILDHSSTVIDEYKRHTGMQIDLEARRVLGGFTFTGDRAFAHIKTLSQGEKVKLIMAILTHQSNDYLILDEPTNHLDIESREVLERALTEYTGGFIVISHDRYFVREIGVDRTLRLQDGSISDVVDPIAHVEYEEDLSRYDDGITVSVKM